MGISRRAILSGLLACLPASAWAEVPADGHELAKAFGARPWVEYASLSPDGSHVAFIAPGKGALNMAMVQNLANGDVKTVTYADGKPLRLASCDWSARDRLVCELYGVSRLEGQNLGWNRIVALDADGTHSLELGKRPATYLPVVVTYDGRVIDWLSGEDGKILMVRSVGEGFGLERVDTRTGKGEPVKPASYGILVTDGNGVVRITGEEERNFQRELTGRTIYRYRLAGTNDLLPFSKVDADGPGFVPIAVDGRNNQAYALSKLDGRDALYRVALDGSFKSELVYAGPVDVDGVETIGRHGRVIGYRYITDRTNIVYFDPVYKAIEASLRKALPKLPIIVFRDASADETKILVFAGSDSDPGHDFIYDRTTRRLTEVLVERPELEGTPLAEQRLINYPASDGTMIPAYLTLPAGADAKAGKAIVLPHGGPASRDEWGFDWLPQFFAARGYAVLQPEFRGSTGFGTAFFNNSGIASWRTAVSDVVDGGRWLIGQHIVDPAKLAIVGWSYGGYAALQVNYLDPGLFKAVVAVAPVADLTALRSDARDDETKKYFQKYMGTIEGSREGSPANHAAVFRAPVLMFHGDRDINVDIGQSREMASALKSAGKSVRLVVYPGLDHQLNDSDVRADLLSQADAFLADVLGHKAGQ